MKKKKEEVQSEQSELEQPELEQPVEEPKEAEEPKEVEEASEPVAKEEEPKKEKKGMPLVLKFIIFELITLIIALGAHFCLLQFVAPLMELDEVLEWAIMTVGAFVLYLVAGYLFNHLIVFKGKGKTTFPKFLLSAFLGWVICMALIHVGILLTKLIVPTNPLHYSLTALSIGHVIAHGGKSTPSGLGILAAVHARDAAEGLADGQPKGVEVDREQILAWDPDVIILDAGNLGLIAEEYAGDAAFFEELRAVQNGRVYQWPNATANYTNVEIPLVSAYYAGCLLYPEAFADMDFETRAEEIFSFFLGHEGYLGLLSEAGLGYGQVALEK